MSCLRAQPLESTECCARNVVKHNGKLKENRLMENGKKENGRKKPKIDERATRAKVRDTPTVKRKPI